MNLIQMLLSLNASPSIKPPGMVEPGNIRLDQRPSIPNPDGGNSSVFSMGIGEGDTETVIPRVVGEEILDPEKAVRSYQESGEHLGKFESVDEANEYGRKLHEDQEAGKFGNGFITPSAQHSLLNVLSSQFW